MELSLDGNLLAADDAAGYRRELLCRIRSLRHLDLKRVSEGDRRAAVAEKQRIKEQEKAAEEAAAVEEEKRMEDEKRQKAIEVAERSWQEEQKAKVKNDEIRANALAAAAKAMQESSAKTARASHDSRMSAARSLSQHP